MKKINYSFLEKFRGKQFWHTLNLVLFFGLYTIWFIIPILLPEYIVITAIITMFIVLIYIILQQSVYRKMELKNAGRRVLYGWIDEEPDVGEEYEIPIKKISPFGRLSIANQEAVEKFMEDEKERISKLVLREDVILSLIAGGNEDD